MIKYKWPRPLYTESMNRMYRMACCGPLAVVALAALPGCLERTIVVTSEPEGAIVYVNDQEIGRTPVETDFKYFGVYEVRLNLEGYDPIVTSRKAATPFYEVPPLDLAAEAVPAKLPTRIAWHFVMTPLASQMPGADKAALRDSLLGRAGELRQSTATAP